MRKRLGIVAAVVLMAGAASATAAPFKQCPPFSDTHDVCLFFCETASCGEQRLADTVDPQGSGCDSIGCRSGDQFGYSVAVDGDLMAIGAIKDQGADWQSGSVFVYRHEAGEWVEEAELHEGRRQDLIGTSVALSGNTLAIGALGDDDRAGNAGAVYIYERDSSGVWTRTAKLAPLGLHANDNFGASVDLDGDTVVIGAPRDNDRGTIAGAAYVFVRQGATWLLETKLAPADLTAFDNFGDRQSVAIAGDTIVVGARHHDTPGEVDSGAAYVFTRSAAVWTQQQLLTASDRFRGDRIGVAVDIIGDLIVVTGTDVDDDRRLTDPDRASCRSKTSSGAAYLFRRTGTQWTEEALLQPCNAWETDWFGEDAALTTYGDFEYLVGGASTSDGFCTAAPCVGQCNSGSVVVFRSRIGSGRWDEVGEYRASDHIDGQRLGWSVAASADTVVSGAFADSRPGPGLNTGAAYVYSLDCSFPTCACRPQLNQAPTCSAGADIVAPCDGVTLVDAVASDPDGEAIEVLWTSNCGAVFTDADMLNPSIAFGGSCGVVCELTLTVTDGSGGECTSTTMVTVDDVTPPQFDTFPADFPIECPTVPGPVAPTATDSCDTQVDVVYLGDTVAAGNCVGSASITRSFSAMDDCDNTVTHNQVITMVDTTPPVFDAPPADTTVECPTIPPPAEPTASDSCSQATVTLVDDTVEPGACTGSATITRRWSARDDCANVVDHTQVITLVDTIGPVFTASLEPLVPALPGSADSSCSAPPVRDLRVVCSQPTDACDLTPTVTAILSVTTTEVSVDGVCSTQTEEVSIACGDVFSVALLAPACPTSPVSAGAVVSPRSDGVPVVTGQRVVLVATATDSCGNATVVEVDPTEENCEGEAVCCPLVTPPPVDCPVDSCPVAPRGGYAVPTERRVTGVRQ